MYCHDQSTTPIACINLLVYIKPGDKGINGKLLNKMYFTYSFHILIASVRCFP